MPVETPTPAATAEIFVHDVPLPLHAALFPLGFPLKLATNAEPVIAAARQSWGVFESVYVADPISLSLTVIDADDEPLPPTPKFRSHGHLMTIVSDAHNQIVCDLARGCAVGWISRRVAESPDFLGLHFLESSVMTTLVARYLAPVHCALIARNGVGVALCGESFAGKSTLAYACARRGWTFVSDDGTFLLRHRPDRYGVGNPFRVRLREDAKSFFPELEDVRVIRRPNGERGMEVKTSDVSISTTSGAVIDHVVFLRRSRIARATMTRHSAQDALTWFEQTQFYGSADAQESQRQTYKRLLEAELWELHYSDLDDAIQVLNDLGVAA